MDRAIFLLKMQIKPGTLSPTLKAGVPMPVPIEFEVRRLLGPREPVIIRIALDAWARWWRNSERTQLYRRSRACLIHNYMMMDANTAFLADRGIHIIPGQETSYFLVEDRLLFRFKKGDDRGLSSNIETQASLAFIEPETPLIELPDVARVDVAYIVNPLETLIQSLLVVARDGDRPLWSYSIYPRAESDTVTTLPVQPKAPAPPDNVVRLPVDATKEKKNRE